MKHVEVFQLREPTVMAIPDNVQEIQYHSMGPRPVRLIGGEQPYAIPTAETITCPVHCLKHAIDGTSGRMFPQMVTPDHVYYQDGDVWIKTEYIAMEPELFKVFDQAVRQPYEEREQVRAARLQDAYNQIEKHKRIVNAFWALPWYKRVWLAITKDC